jgi:septal ring factor EnvC (AmiA/AmiB activator)
MTSPNFKQTSQTTEQRSTSRRFPCVAAATLLAACLLSLAAPRAQANVLGQLRDSIASLWSQKAGRHNAAQSARVRAQGLSQQAETLHDRLQRTQREVRQFNETYYALWRQMRSTEAKLVESRHRVHIVTARYNRRRILFGRRLAAMQRSGRLSYLQMFLGSRTLSDLTRRTYLFETVTQRDAELQAAIRHDKNELEIEQTHLMAQWHRRNRVQRAANRERERIVLAEREQQATLKQINASRNAQLSYALAQEKSSRELAAMIGNLAARRDSITQSYEAAREQQAEHARWYSSYESDARPRYRRASYSEDDSSERNDSRSNYRRSSYRRSSYRQSSYRQSGYRSSYRRRGSGRLRRVDGSYRALFLPRSGSDGGGGLLKPMTVRDLIRQDTLAPAPPNRNSGGREGGDNSGNASEGGQGAPSEEPAPEDH